MTFDGNIDMLEMAFWQIILSSAPVLLIALAIGLFIGIFQAATSINEMTLSFVPKVIILCACGIKALGVPRFFLVESSQVISP